MFRNLWLSCCCALAMASVAAGQSINIDFATLDGSPANGYAAALAGNAGQWNSYGGVTGGATVQNLVDIGGNVTGVSFVADQTKGAFSGTWANGPEPTGDTLALMGDLLNIGGLNSTLNLSFSGLVNGSYNIVVYAFAGDNSAGDWRTDINVNGLGAQSIGGAYSGDYAAGVTHALYENVTIADGMVNIDVLTTVGFGSVNGIQFQLIPAPGALALLGLAGLVGSRRRRS